jgi:hypothetical protein
VDYGNRNTSRCLVAGRFQCEVCAMIGQSGVYRYKSKSYYVVGPMIHISEISKGCRGVYL